MVFLSNTFRRCKNVIKGTTREKGDHVGHMQSNFLHAALPHNLV